MDITCLWLKVEIIFKFIKILNFDFPVAHLVLLTIVYGSLMGL